MQVTQTRSRSASVAAFTLMVLQQMCGINILTFYSKETDRRLHHYWQFELTIWKPTSQHDSRVRWFHSDSCIRGFCWSKSAAVIGLMLGLTNQSFSLVRLPGLGIYAPFR